MIFLVLDFTGLTILHFGLLGNRSLWSLKVIKAIFSGSCPFTIELMSFWIQLILHIDIINNDISIILHCRKSFLFNKVSTWFKKNSSLFDFTLGSFDEKCKLVSLFLLQQLAQVVGIDKIRLYQDNGLAILKNVTGHESKCIKKNIIFIFQRHGLKLL